MEFLEMRINQGLKKKVACVREEAALFFAWCPVDLFSLLDAGTAWGL